MYPILAAESAGFAAIVTAVGGVGVSLATVYLNSRKQAASTGENKGQIDALTEQIASLAIQVSSLKSENAALKLQLQLIEAQNKHPEPELEPEPAPTPKPKPKKKPTTAKTAAKPKKKKE